MAQIHKISYAVIYPGRVVPGKRIRNNFYRALQNYEYGNGDIESIVSYLGLVKHYNSKKIVGRIFDKLGQEYKFFGA